MINSCWGDLYKPLFVLNQHKERLEEGSLAHERWLWKLHEACQNATIRIESELERIRQARVIDGTP